MAGVIQTPFETIIQASTPQEEIEIKETAQNEKRSTVGRPKTGKEIQSRRISLVVPQSLYDKIDETSRSKRQTVNGYINEVLKTILGE